MKVIRKTLVGNSEAFQFNVSGLRFLVKNFSENDIFVNTEPIDDSNLLSSIKIPSEVAQVVVVNEYDTPNVNSVRQQGYAVNTLYIKGTGEVEVQVLLW